MLAAAAKRAANKPGLQPPKRVLMMIATMKSRKGLDVLRGVACVNTNARILVTSAVPKVKSGGRRTDIISPTNLKQRKRATVEPLQLYSRLTFLYTAYLLLTHSRQSIVVICDNARIAFTTKTKRFNRFHFEASPCMLW